MSDALIQTPEFRVFSVLRQSFSILIRNFVPFGLISILILSPAYIFLYVSDPDSPVYDPFDASMGINDVVFDSVYSILDDFLTAVLVYGVFQGIRGQPVSIFQSLSRGFRLILPVIGVVIIMGLISAAEAALFYVMQISPTETGEVIYSFLVIIGSVFFIYIFLILSVVVPAAVVEGHFLSSFSRSIFLTKGNRWRLLGLWVLFFLLFVIVQYLAGLIGAEIGSKSSVFLLTWAAEAMISAFGAVVFTVVYYRLRLVKDGVDENEIAAVFD